MLSAEGAVFQYKCDNYYAPGAEGAVAWNDPALAIDWRLPATDVILSEKTAATPSSVRQPCCRPTSRPHNPSNRLFSTQ